MSRTDSGSIRGVDPSEDEYTAVQSPVRETYRAEDPAVTVSCVGHRVVYTHRRVGGVYGLQSEPTGTAMVTP